MDVILSFHTVLCLLIRNIVLRRPGATSDHRRPSAQWAGGARYLLGTAAALSDTIITIFLLLLFSILLSPQAASQWRPTGIPTTIAWWKFRSYRQRCFFFLFVYQTDIERHVCNYSAQVWRTFGRAKNDCAPRRWPSTTERNHLCGRFGRNEIAIIVGWQWIRKTWRLKRTSRKLRAVRAVPATKKNHRR